MIGIGEFFALASAFAWGLAVILFRLSGQQLGPFALNLFKNSLMLVLLAPTILLVHGVAWPAISTAHWAILLLSGFIGIGIADTLFFRALNSLGPSRTAIGSMLLSPFVILLSVVFLGERLGWLQWSGVALTLVGVTLVNWRRVHPLAPKADQSGLLALVAAMALMASGIVMAKPLLESEPFIWAVQIRVIGGVGGMLIMMWVQRRQATVLAEFVRAKAWGLTVAASSMGTYVAMLMWLAGYKYADASIAAVLNETSAVFVLILAAAFLKERMVLRQWLGSIVAAVGVLVVVAG